jgi:hypothetical protein
LTQIQLWGEFEKFRSLINDKAFGADYNVHCPCHPPGPRISGVCQDLRQVILQRRSLLSRRMAPLAATASQRMMAREVLLTPGVWARDQKKNWNNPDRLISRRTAI